MGLTAKHVKNQMTKEKCVKKLKKPLQFECTACDAKFAYKAILYRHISTYHSGKNCVCLKCGKIVCDLKLHIQKEHPHKNEASKIEIDKKIEKKARELEEKYKNCVVTYRCLTCPNFKTPEPS